MSGTGHTSAHKGKRVRVFLRDGKYIDGKFIEKSSKRVHLEHCSIDISRIKCVTIYKREEK